MKKEFDRDSLGRAFPTLFELQTKLRSVLKSDASLGIKEVSANILWQLENCDPIEPHNMDFEVMKTLTADEIICLNALCETSNQLRANPDPSLTLEKEAEAYYIGS